MKGENMKALKSLLILSALTLVSCGGSGEVDKDIKGKRYFGDKFQNAPAPAFNENLAPYISIEMNEEGTGGVLNASRYVKQEDGTLKIYQITVEEYTHFNFTVSQNDINLTFTYSTQDYFGFLPKTATLTSSGLNAPFKYSDTNYTLEFVIR